MGGEDNTGNRMAKQTTGGNEPAKLRELSPIKTRFSDSLHFLRILVSGGKVETRLYLRTNDCLPSSITWVRPRVTIRPYLGPAS